MHEPARVFEAQSSEMHRIHLDPSRHGGSYSHEPTISSRTHHDTCYDIHQPRFRLTELLQPDLTDHRHHPWSL